MGRKIFAIQDGGQCFTEGPPKQGKWKGNHKAYGVSDKCESDGKGGPMANEVYVVIEGTNYVFEKTMTAKNYDISSFFILRCVKFAFSNVNLILKLGVVQSANFANLGVQVTEENLSTLMESVNTFARKMAIVGPEDITKVVLTVGSVRIVSSLKESIIHRIYSVIF